MSGPLRFRLLATLAFLVAGVALAHDDDPKVKSDARARLSVGFRNALIADPGGNAGTLEMGSGGFPASGVTLLSWLPLSAFGGSQGGNDCWGYTSPSGREYAIFGHWDGTSFVEVTNPTNPVILATIPTPTSGSGNLWRDMKTYGHWCYSVSEVGGGIQVIDMSQIDSGIVTLHDSVTGPSTNATHNVAIDEDSGFLYRCGGGDNGLRIYTLADPSKPAFVSSWSAKYVHDAQVVTYFDGPYAGKQIAFCFSGFNGGWVQPGVDILDVTNKQSIQILSSFSYPQATYSHQGWLTPDRKYLYIGDELDESEHDLPTTTHVYDVTSLTSPVYAGSFTNGNPAIGHNMYTLGSRAYQANYRSGLRIFDITDPVGPTEVAFFDTYPANDNKDFTGLWSCYPYFPSGIVIGSDRNSGLFVWWVGEPELAFSFPQGLPELIDPAGASLPVTIAASGPGSYLPGSALLHLDDGSGWVSLPMNELGGESFEAVFPQTACGAHLRYYFTATGSSGIHWADPQDAPLSLYEATAGLGLSLVHFDDLESTSGWTVGDPSDTATSGTWVLVDPIGTAAQPEDDHTPPPGVLCWVTGQGTPNGSTGEADVDGGATTLISPVYDLSGYSAPIVSYWRWYSNHVGASPYTDVFVVDVSNDGGASWVNVETVGPTGPEVEGGWYQHRFLLSDLLAPTANVRLRFVASDFGPGSIVEAALDDLAIEEVECAFCGTASYCQTAPNSAGSGAHISGSGLPSVADNAFVLEVIGAVPGQSGIFYYGPQQVEIPFGDGFRCVGGGALGTFRLYPPLVADPFGDASRPLDLTQPPADSGPGMIQPGDTWNFQFWYRDPGGPGGTGFNFSGGLAVTFCP